MRYSLARASSTQAPPNSQQTATPSMSSHSKATTTTDSGSTTAVPVPVKEKRTSKVQKPQAVNKPSLFSLLASQRFARQIAQKIYHKRAVRLNSDTVFSSAPPPALEPTYRMEPKRQFNTAVILRMLTTILNERLRDFEYSPNLARWFVKKLSDEVRNRLKRMNIDRYKVVCVASIGQKHEQGLMVASRCLWNPHFDTSVTHTWQNESAYCNIAVYAIYCE